MCVVRRAVLPAILSALALSIFFSPAAAPSLVSARQTPPVTPESQPTSAQPTVTLHVTVLGGRDRDQLRFVTGLKRENFSVVERKRPREITHFAAADEPFSVGILVDTSGSFRDTYKDTRLGIIREGVARLVYHGHPANEYFITTFSARAQTSSEWTRDPVLLAKTVGSTPTGGLTPLYDACIAAVERLARGTHPKRALVLISDGQDTASRRKLKEMRRLLRVHGVQLYAVGPGLTTDNTDVGRNSRTALKEWTEATGGQAFFPRYGREVLSTFDRVAATLRHQYTVGFAPAAPEAEERWHEVKVNVDAPPEFARELKHVRVYARDGYFTPPAAP